MSGHAQPQQCSLRDEELASKQKILHVRQGKASEAVLEIALATGMRRGHPWARATSMSRPAHCASRDRRETPTQRLWGTSLGPLSALSHNPSSLAVRYQFRHQPRAGAFGGAVEFLC